MAGQPPWSNGLSPSLGDWQAHQKKWQQAPDVLSDEEMVALRPPASFVPFDQGAIDAMQQERMGLLEKYRQNIEGGHTAAQYQHQRGVNTGANQLGSTVSAHGFSPSAARGTAMASAQLRAQGGVDQRAIRAGELQNYHQMRQGANQEHGAAYMQGMGNQQRYIGERQQELGREEALNAKLKAEQIQRDTEQAAAIVSGVGSAIGAAAGTNSDARNKDRYRMEGMRDAYRAMGSRGASSDADRMAIERAFGSDADRQSNSLVRQLQQSDDQLRRHVRGGVLTPEEAEASRALSRIKPEVWSYKPEAQDRLGLTPRTQFGPMTQNLREASPLTAASVYDTPAGDQVVDTGSATMAQFGMLSSLGKRLDALEGQASGKMAGTIDPGVEWRKPKGY